MFGQCGRHSRGTGNPERQRAGTGLHQQRIGMTVVAALEFDDGVAPGKSPGQANRAHGRLGTGADHPHHVHGRHQFAKPRGHSRFDLRRGTIAEPPVHRLVNGLTHGGMRVSQHHRAPGTDIVDITLAFRGPDVRALGPLDEDRCPAHALEGPDRRIDTAWDHRFGLLKQFFVGHDND